MGWLSFVTCTIVLRMAIADVCLLLPILVFYGSPIKLVVRSALEF
jgi:hypothetical protein